MHPAPATTKNLLRYASKSNTYCLSTSHQSRISRMGGIQLHNWELNRKLMTLCTRMFQSLRSWPFYECGRHHLPLGRRESETVQGSRRGQKSRESRTSRRRLLRIWETMDWMTMPNLMVNPTEFLIARLGDSCN